MLSVFPRKDIEAKITIHDNNIMEISAELQDAIYHIERNGNSKIILTDLSIKLTRLLHKKSQANAWLLIIYVIIMLFFFYFITSWFVSWI